MLHSNTTLDLSKSKIHFLPFLDNYMAKAYLNKGWNLPNVWDFMMLDKVYREFHSLDIKTKYNLYKNISNSTEGKGNRLIYEYYNALICFGLIDEEKNVNNLEVHFHKNETVKNIDENKLSEIYFSYFRFKELSSWFLKYENLTKNIIDSIDKDILINSSFPIFTTSFNDIAPKKSSKKSIRRLTDTIFYNFEDNIDTYQIPIEQDKIMRFFEVFLHWGVKLKVIECINVTDGLNTNCLANGPKKIRLYYYVNNNTNIDVSEFINLNYNSNTKVIYIPELITNMALVCRNSVARIQESIISQTNTPNGKFSLQRTSKVFITKSKKRSTYERDREKLYPKIGNAFISHIILR